MKKLFETLKNNLELAEQVDGGPIPVCWFTGNRSISVAFLEVKHGAYTELPPYQ